MGSLFWATLYNAVNLAYRNMLVIRLRMCVWGADVMEEWGADVMEECRRDEMPPPVISISLQHLETRRLGKNCMFTSEHFNWYNSPQFAPVVPECIQWNTESLTTLFGTILLLFTTSDNIITLSIKCSDQLILGEFAILNLTNLSWSEIQCFTVLRVGAGYL